MKKVSIWLTNRLCVGEGLMTGAWVTSKTTPPPKSPQDETRLPHSYIDGIPLQLAFCALYSLATAKNMRSCTGRSTLHTTGRLVAGRK